MSFNDRNYEKIRIIGVTGPIGAGKSYVTGLFKKEGFKTIDSDRVYHILTNKKTPLTDEIASEFGQGVLNTDGSLNRAELSKIVFNDKQKLQRLNEITHQKVIAYILNKCKLNFEKGECTTVVEVPMMFESGFDKHCSDVICVVADEDTRIKRIMKRNGFSEDEAKKRIKNQKNIEFYIENSDKIVYNDAYAGAREDFRRVLAELFG